jgi:hypothetical protein
LLCKTRSASRVITVGVNIEFVAIFYLFLLVGLTRTVITGAARTARYRALRAFFSRQRIQSLIDVDSS